MDLDKEVSPATVIGAFNLTAQRIGFLQPFFSIGNRVNHPYIQKTSSHNLILAFEETTWPESDTFGIENGITTTVGEESIWAFIFPNEPPLILPWEAFRRRMQELFENSHLIERPLLQFDIATTLGLEDLIGNAALNAYRAYTRYGGNAAGRWRDRYILEPAINEAIGQPKLTSQNKTQENEELRVFIENKNLVIETTNENIPPLSEEIKKAYTALCNMYPEIFIENVALKFLVKPSKFFAVDKKRASRIYLYINSDSTRLFGKTAQENNIIIIDQKTLIAFIQNPSEKDACFIITDSIEEKFYLEERANVRSYKNMFFVKIKRGAAKSFERNSDVSEHDLPTICIENTFTSQINQNFLDAYFIFVLSIVSRQQTPEVSIETIENSARKILETSDAVFFRVLLRPKTTDVYSRCQIMIQLIRRFIPSGSRVIIYSNDSIQPTRAKIWIDALSAAYKITYTSISIDTKVSRNSVLVCAEQYRNTNNMDVVEATRLVSMAFEMLNWTISRNGSSSLNSFKLHDPKRSKKYDVIVVRKREDWPTQIERRSPSYFDQPKVIIVHLLPKKEEILSGNLGDYFHIALDEIPAIRPGSNWVWSILQQQLSRYKNNNSLTKLRLCAAIALRAIEEGRMERQTESIDSEKIVYALSRPNIDRFVQLSEKWRKSNEILMRFRKIEFEDYNSKNIEKIEIYLKIQREGPTVIFFSAEVDQH
jgi:hypothetical protein